MFTAAHTTAGAAAERRPSSSMMGGQAEAPPHRLSLSAPLNYRRARAPKWSARRASHSRRQPRGICAVSRRAEPTPSPRPQRAAPDCIATRRGRRRSLTCSCTLRAAVVSSNATTSTSDALSQNSSVPSRSGPGLSFAPRLAARTTASSRAGRTTRACICGAAHTPAFRSRRCAGTRALSTWLRGDRHESRRSHRCSRPSRMITQSSCGRAVKPNEGPASGGSWGALFSERRNLEVSGL